MFQNLSSTHTIPRSALSVCDTSRRLPSVGIASNSRGRRQSGPWLTTCSVSLPPYSLAQQACRMHGGQPKPLAQKCFASMMADSQPIDAFHGQPAGICIATVRLRSEIGGRIGGKCSLQHEAAGPREQQLLSAILRKVILTWENGARGLMRHRHHTFFRAHPCV